MDIVGAAFGEIIDVPVVETYLQVTLYLLHDTFVR